MCGRIYLEEIYTNAVNGKVCEPAVLYDVHLSSPFAFLKFFLEGLDFLRLNEYLRIIITKVNK